MTYGNATYLEQSVRTTVDQGQNGTCGVTTLDFILMDVQFAQAPDTPGHPSPIKLYVPKNADQPSLYDVEIHEKEALKRQDVWNAFATVVAIAYLARKHPWATALPLIKSSSYSWDGNMFLFSFRAVAELRARPRDDTLP